MQSVGGGGEPRGKAPNLNVGYIVLCDDCNKCTLMTSHNKLEHVICCNPTCPRNEKTWHGMKYKQEHFSTYHCHHCGGVLRRAHGHEEYAFERLETEHTFQMENQFDHTKWTGAGGLAPGSRTTETQSMVTYDGDIASGGWAELLCTQCGKTNWLYTVANHTLACNQCGRSLKLKIRKKSRRFTNVRQTVTCAAPYTRAG